MPDLQGGSDGPDELGHPGSLSDDQRSLGILCGIAKGQPVATPEIIDLAVDDQLLEELENYKADHVFDTRAKVHRHQQPGVCLKKKTSGGGRERDEGREREARESKRKGDKKPKWCVFLVYHRNR